MENNASNRIHPLVAGAAISVMLVSLTGVAAITGILPVSHSSGSSATQVAGLTDAAASAPISAALVQPLPAAVPAAPAKPEIAESKPEPKAAPTRTVYVREPQPRKTYEPAPAKVAQAPAVCYSCGRVEAVQAIQHAAQPSGVGMVAGALLGGVLGNQVGGGNGKKIATVAGAVGGGYAGNVIERNTRSTTSYQVRVRMEDGDVRSFPYEQQPGWGIGDRVRIVNGQIVPRA